MKACSIIMSIFSLVCHLSIFYSFRSSIYVLASSSTITCVKKNYTCWKHIICCLCVLAELCVSVFFFFFLMPILASSNIYFGFVPLFTQKIINTIFIFLLLALFPPNTQFPAMPEPVSPQPRSILSSLCNFACL